MFRSLNGIIFFYFRELSELNNGLLFIDVVVGAVDSASQRLTSAAAAAAARGGCPL